MNLKYAFLFLKRNRAKASAIFLLVLALLISLTLIYFLELLNSSLVDNVYSSIPYRVGIRGKVTERYGVYNPQDEINYDLEMIDESLKDLAQNFKATYDYEFSLKAFSSNAYFRDSKLSLLGISTEVLNENLKLSSGRLFKDDQNEIVVPDDLLIKKGNKIKKVQVGDKIVIGCPDFSSESDEVTGELSNSQEYIVTGLYKKETVSTIITNASIYQNSQVIYISKEKAFDYYRKLHDVFIDSASQSSEAELLDAHLIDPDIVLDDYDLIKEVKNALEGIVQELNLTSVGGQYAIASSLDEADRILNVIASYETNIILILTSINLALLAALFFAIRNIYAQRSKDTCINLALGRSKSSIFGGYFLETLILTLLALPISLILSFTLSSLINEKVIAHNLNSQSLALLVTGRKDMTGDLSSFLLNEGINKIDPFVLCLLIASLLIFEALVIALFIRKVDLRSLTGDLRKIE